MPVGVPLAQKASSNGTHVHCSIGALIGIPTGMPPPPPELELLALLELCPDDVDDVSPPDPEVVASGPPEQAARATKLKSDASVRRRCFIARVQRRSAAPSSLAKRRGFRANSETC